MTADRSPGRVARCSICHAVYGGGERFCPHDGGAVVDADAADPLVGRTIGGRYFIRRPIGRGGMGVVYEAEHVGLDKRMALKFISDRYAGDRDALHRFHREARTASRIGHENIVAVTDVGETEDGKSYIAMELMDGRDLGQLLRESGGMEVGRALGIMEQILRGLGAAHAEGIVHRDMKPENVFLTERRGAADFVKIMDFGISKVVAARDENVRLTDTGAVVGTPIYMAPEQAQGAPDLDHRVDLYAAGVMLYEMLAGRPPFVATTYAALVSQHLHDPPPALAGLRPDLPPALCAAVHRALEKDPARRWESAGAFADALAAVPVRSFREDGDTLSMKADASGGLAAPMKIDVPVFRPAPRSQPRAARVALLLGGIAAAASVAVWRARDAGDETSDAASDEARRSDPPPAAAKVEAPPAVQPPVEPAPAPAVQPLDSPEPPAAPASASLEIDSGPRGAQVFVDGEHRGRTPLRIDVAVGSHTVRLELRGFQEVEAEKIVRAGYAETFFAALARRGSSRRAHVTQGGRERTDRPPDTSATDATNRDGESTPPPAAPPTRPDPEPDPDKRKSNPYLDLRSPRPP